RKRNLEEINPNECERGQRPHHKILERFAPDSNYGDDNDRRHRGFQSVKDRRDPRQISKRGVDVTQRPKNEDRWNNKERAGNDTAPNFVEEPADVDGELLRLRSRKEHAEIQRVQKARLADPFFLFDQLALHNRDLAGRSAERNESELQPKPEGFTERRRTEPLLRLMSILCVAGRLVHSLPS